MNTPKKTVFVFGDTALTLCPDDIMAVWAEYEKSHPGKTARDMSSDEFSKRLLDRMRKNARPTRTILHN